LAESKRKFPSDYTLSIVIPIFNEEENLIPLTEEFLPILKETGRGFEVIFVNDASTDSSLEILRQLAKKYNQVRAISFEENCGQTSAFDAGFKAAKNDVIVTMDGDMQNDPNDIPRLLEKIGEYDMAIGWRRERHDTFIRRISSTIANAVRRRGLSDPYHDVGCSLKAFRRDAMLELKLFNHMHRFFPILFDMEGFSVAEVKVNHRERAHGEAKYGIRNRLVQGLKSIKYVRYMQENKLKYKIKEEL